MWDRVVQIFEPDYYVSWEAVSEAVRDRSSFNLSEQSSITKVDVFPRKDDQFREAEFARRRRVTIGDFATWLVTAEDLVIVVDEYLAIRGSVARCACVVAR